MSSNIVASLGTSNIINIVSGQSLGIYTQNTAEIYKLIETPNHPPQKILLGTVNNTMSFFGPYSGLVKLIINSGDLPTYYAVGTAPYIIEELSHLQIAPTALSISVDVPVSYWVNGLITTNPAGAIALTLPSGADLEAAAGLNINDAFECSVVNVNGTNAATMQVVALSGHTFVGYAVVAANASVRFRTVKTAVNTYITYRVAG